MKAIYSIIACIAIFLTLLQYRVAHSDMASGNRTLKVTEWDAFGYYAYLPAIFIYHDVKHLDWLTDIDKKYAVTGGNGWQAEKQPNGNYVFKYLGGVAILELPLFCIGHCIALMKGYPPDGFSPPYQYALGFGIIFYCLLAVLLLRRILLTWFNDVITTITLIMVCLATNFIQYAAVDNAQSHAYIFPLYVLIIYASMQWHKRPTAGWAFAIGYIIGLATISRPTEAIMLFIPLFWSTHTKESAKAKWQLVKQNRPHLYFASAGGFLGILPQLIYWKITSGSFIFDVGSKWDFLNPHFRVLFGWEKGWFIYTPVTLLFIAGMFVIRQFPFRKSVLWFCLLNIYIIIAWHDWRYGGSYSTRALVQSYPVFALPFAALTEKALQRKWCRPFYVICAYLLVVNLFQINQYCATILHYDDMNRKYYSRIYLNPNPTPMDMSMLDNDEMLTSENSYQKNVIARTDTASQISFAANTNAVVTQADFNTANNKDTWLKIESTIKAPKNLWQSYLNADVNVGDSVKHARVRLFSPISKEEGTNNYAFYMHVPASVQRPHIKLYITSPSDFNGTVLKTNITELQK